MSGVTFAEFLRRAGKTGFEYPVEGLLVVIAAFQGNVQDVAVCAREQMLGMGKPQGIYIVGKADAEHVGKNPGKNKFSGSELRGDRGQGNVLTVMIGNIGQNICGKLSGGELLIFCKSEHWQQTTEHQADERPCQCCIIF